MVGAGAKYSPLLKRFNKCKHMDTFKSNLAQFFILDQEQLFFYWKGRVALYAFLKAMGIKPDDEVILPAYTCVVVPNAILYLGAKPVYIDVSKDTYNIDISQVEAAITDRTKVIICQNTYGLSSNLEKLVAIAKQYNLYTIEDCTHGFGGTYEGKPNGQFCDAAFFSTQWNKPFSTGVGGFSVANNKIIEDRLSAFNSELIAPSVKDLLNLKVLYFIKRFLINEITYWPLVKCYRWLSKNNIVVGSSSGEEIISINMPDNYFKGFSNVQAKEGLRTLPKLTADLVTRKKNAAIYTDFLIKLGKNHVAEKWFANHAFLKYPLLVNQRSEFMALAEKHRINLGEWFTSPLHPVEGDLSAWKFQREHFPVAQYLSSHVVNLPTTPSNIDRVLSFLEQHSDFIVE